MKKLLTLVLCSFMLLGSRAVAQESFTANVSAPGTLAEVLGDKTNTIESLTVVGPVDAADFATMKAACADGLLSKINLAQAKIADNKIPDKAFFEPRYNVSKLSEIVLPDGLVAIGDVAFLNTALTGIVLPPTIKTLGHHCFTSCQDLKEIDIPEGVEVIPGGCFSLCRRLEKITLPEGLTEIKEDAFTTTTCLKTIILPESLRFLGNSVFIDSGIESLHIPAACTSLGTAVVALCRQLKEVTFGGVPEAIPAEFVEFSYQLSRCDIPAGVTSIGPRAFQDCRALTSIDLPAGLETIGEWAFNLAGLKTLVMPASIKNVGGYAFRECPLEAVYSLAVDPIVNHLINGPLSGIFTCSPDLPVYVPRGAAENYINKATGGWWNHFTNFIEVDDVAAAGIDDAMQPGGVSVTARGGAIEVEGSGEFTVYSADGRAVASGMAPARVEAAPGLYIVRAGTSTVKLKI